MIPCSRRSLSVLVFVSILGAGCGSSSSGAEAQGSAATGGVGGGAAAGGNGAGGAGGGGDAAACAPILEGDTLRLAAGVTLGPGEESTMCLRYTTPVDIDITSFVGTLGPAAGHHALLLGHQKPTAPDGLAPCSEPELMDAQASGAFQMLAGVSYE